MKLCATWTVFASNVIKVLSCLPIAWGKKQKRALLSAFSTSVLPQPFLWPWNREYSNHGLNSQNGNWGNCKCQIGYSTVLQFCAEFWFLSTAGTFLGFCQRLFAGWSSNVPLSFVVFVALFIQCASFLLQCYLAPNIVSYCGSSKHKDYRRTKLCKLSLLLEKHHRHGVGAIDFYTTV